MSDVIRERDALHSHRCMRCGGVFTCRTPELCGAQYDVLPTIVMLVNGQPRVTEHCPPGTTVASRTAIVNAVDSVLRHVGEEDMTNYRRYDAMIERIVDAVLPVVGPPLVVVRSPIGAPEHG